METLGKILDDIRQNQNVSIASLCEGIISESTYSRFIRGKTNLASDSFIKIIRRLNMPVGMFLQEYLDFFQLNHDYTVLNHAHLSNDLAIVDTLISAYQLKQVQIDWRACDERFLMLLYFLKSAANPASGSTHHLARLVEALHSLKFYTRNDLEALKLLLAYLEPADAEMLVQRVLKETVKSQDPIVRAHSAELCARLYIQKLQSKQPEAAYDYYCLLKEIAKDQSDLGLKITVKVLNCLHLYFNEKQDASIRTLEELVIFLDDLYLPFHGQALRSLLTELGIPMEERNIHYADEL